jgi:hypothetical protein
MTEMNSGSRTLLKSGLPVTAESLQCVLIIKLPIIAIPRDAAYRFTLTFIAALA